MGFLTSLQLTVNSTHFEYDWNSFEEFYFPHLWKEGLVIPVLRRFYPNCELSSYRTPFIMFQSLREIYQRRINRSSPPRIYTILVFYSWLYLYLHLPMFFYAHDPQLFSSVSSLLKCNRDTLVCWCSMNKATINFSKLWSMYYLLQPFPLSFSSLFRRQSLLIFSSFEKWSNLPWNRASNWHFVDIISHVCRMSGFILRSSFNINSMYLFVTLSTHLL